jgi:MFS family permease
MNPTIIFILVINTLQSIGLSASKIALALIALELGASPFVVGMLAALFSLAAATLSVPTGRLADQFGARWLLVGGSFGAGSGLLLPFFYPSLPSVLIAGALVGLSLACFNVTLQNLTGLFSTSRDRARNFSNYSLSMSGGQLVGPLLGGFLVEHNSIAQVCLFLSLLAFGPLVVLALRRGPLEQGAVYKPTARASTAHGEGTLALFRHRGIRKTIITASFLSSGLNLMQAYMPVYAHSVGISASVIGVIVAMNATAAFFVRALLPRLIAELKEQRVLGLAFCFGATAILLIPMFQNPIMLGVLAFFFGLGMGASQPVVSILIFQFAPPGRSGEAIGLKITTNHLTNMVSPLVFGGIATVVGLTPMFLLNGLMLVAGGFIAWPRKGRKPWAGT